MHKQLTFASCQANQLNLIFKVGTRKECLVYLEVESEVSVHKNVAEKKKEFIVQVVSESG